MVPTPPKPDGLGVLKSFNRLTIVAGKVRNALAGNPDVKLARAEIKILSRELNKGKGKAQKADKETINLKIQLRALKKKLKKKKGS